MRHLCVCFLLYLLGCTKKYKRKNRKGCKMVFGSLTMYSKFGSLSNFECFFVAWLSPIMIPCKLKPYGKSTYNALQTLSSTPCTCICIHEIYALKWLVPRTLQGYQVGLVVVIVTFCQSCCNSPRTDLLLCTLFAPITFCISIVFNFSWDDCNTKEKRKTKVMQNFGKQIRCIMGDVQVVNKTKNVEHCFWKENGLKGA